MQGNQAQGLAQLGKQINPHSLTGHWPGKGVGLTQLGGEKKTLIASQLIGHMRAGGRGGGGGLTKGGEHTCG
eukprot:6177085-Prymnesium_polylepis.1